MSRLFWLATVGVLVTGLTIAWLGLPQATGAQCGSIESSCFKCHQETHPVCGKTEWHSEYGHFHACWHCHGGNDTAQDKALAHVGVARHPLEDTYTSCYACHPTDYLQLAERFTKTLGEPVATREPVSRTLIVALPVADAPKAVPLIVSPSVTKTCFDWVWVLWLSLVPASGIIIWLVWRKSV